MAAKELFQEGQQLFIHGKYKESIEKFSQALEAGHDEAAARLGRGAAYLKVQDLHGALKDFNKILVLDPEHERAHYYRGLAWLNESRFEEALTDLNKSIARNSGRGAAFLARGLAKAELGQEEAAMDDFKTAVAHSSAEVEHFLQGFGAARTRFSRSMALLEGERGPVTRVLSPEEAEKLRGWLEPEKEHA